MKTLLFCMGFSLVALLTNGQDATLRSNYALIGISEFKTEFKNRQLIFYHTYVVVTKLYNGGVEDATFDIDSVRQREYNKKDHLWFYCTDRKEDIINGKQRAVFLIQVKGAEVVKMFLFATEVDVFPFVFNLERP